MNTKQPSIAWNPAKQILAEPLNDGVAYDSSNGGVYRHIIDLAQVRYLGECEYPKYYDRGFWLFGGIGLRDIEDFFTGTASPEELVEVTKAKIEVAVNCLGLSMDKDIKKH